MSISKEFADRETMSQSILALRNELIKQSNTKSREIVFKLNSCLFSNYPAKES